MNFMNFARATEQRSSVEEEPHGRHAGGMGERLLAR
jgi:hypothetical protein